MNSTILGRSIVSDNIAIFFPQCLIAGDWCCWVVNEFIDRQYGLSMLNPKASAQKMLGTVKKKTMNSVTIRSIQNLPWQIHSQNPLWFEYNVHLSQWIVSLDQEWDAENWNPFQGMFWSFTFFWRIEKRKQTAQSTRIDLFVFHWTIDRSAHFKKPGFKQSRILTFILKKFFKSFLQIVSK